MLKLKVASTPFLDEQKVVWLVSCDSFLCNFASDLSRKLCKCWFWPFTDLFVQVQERLVFKNPSLMYHLWNLSISDRIYLYRKKIMCCSSLIYTISTCSLSPFSPHWFYYLAASAACFTAPFQFSSSFSISHSLPVINMHVFHNPHREMYRNITHPTHLNPTSMTCWQNNAI